jgi:hypothetical protein
MTVERVGSSGFYDLGARLWPFGYITSDPAWTLPLSITVAVSGVVIFRTGWAYRFTSMMMAW